MANPSLSQREGGEQLNGRPERNFQESQPASGVRLRNKCFPSPWLTQAAGEGTTHDGNFFQPCSLQSKHEEGGWREPLA